MSGFVYQSLGIAFEAARLVAIQKLLTGLKLTPLVALYNFAPVRSPLLLFAQGAQLTFGRVTTGLRHPQRLPHPLL